MGQRFQHALLRRVLGVLLISQNRERRAVDGALETRAVERNFGQGIGALAVVADHNREAIPGVEVLVVIVDVVLAIDQARGEEACLDVMEAAQLPGRYSSPAAARPRGGRTSP